MNQTERCTQPPMPRRLLSLAHIRPVQAAALIPAVCRPWIQLTSSMTAEIGRVLGSPPQVIPLREAPDRISRWEADCLGVPFRRRAYAREVALAVSGQVTMLARSVADIHDPMAGVLRRLQTTPLAEVLFEDWRWRRLGEPVPLRWRRRAGSIFGRACLWQRDGPWRSRVLVEEYFLSPLLAPIGRSTKPSAGAHQHVAPGPSS